MYDLRQLGPITSTRCMLLGSSLTAVGMGWVHMCTWYQLTLRTEVRLRHKCCTTHTGIQTEGCRLSWWLCLDLRFQEFKPTTTNETTVEWANSIPVWETTSNRSYNLWWSQQVSSSRDTDTNNKLLISHKKNFQLLAQAYPLATKIYCFARLTRKDSSLYRWVSQFNTWDIGLLH